VPALAARDGEPRWLAPAPRAENGRFANPVGPLGHGSLGIRFPFMLRRIRASFDLRAGAPVDDRADGAYFRGPGDSPRVTWIGHATVLVEMDGVRFLTDPTWSKTASPVSFAGPPRLAPPGIALAALPPIDFVVISHNHYDHLDVPSLVALAERDPLTQFIVPLGNGELLRDAGITRVIELDWTERTRIGNVLVHCLPVQHWSKRSLFDDNRALWASWAVTGPTRRVYFGGDTGYFDGFREIGEALGPFDLAVLPIGAYAPREMMRASHMNPEEAWQAGLDVRSEAVLGVHFGTFDLSDEEADEPPRRLRATALADEREDDAWVFAIGESRSF
ncbi:unnamed protein product, partial [Discosporangium mesarthrocarpum]